MRTLPREIDRVSTKADLRAGRHVCENLPAGIARGERALRIYLKEEFPTYDTAVMLRACVQPLGG